MGESRLELLQWVNALCGLNYSKIEQCGTGAAYCQIMDSLYRDVPLSKVKFEVKGEHESVANFKVLQSNFSKHKVDKLIPVDKLVKMKMQDNLDFVQWLKRYWETNNSGEPYDPASRRKGAPGVAALKPAAPTTKAAPTATRRPGAVPAKKPTASPSVNTTRGSANNGATSRASQGTNGPASRPASAARVVGLQREVDELTGQILNLNVAHEALTQEREFYYLKLREIELLIQTKIDSDPEIALDPLFRDIQTILYSTNDEFELPLDDVEHFELQEELNDAVEDIF